VDFRYSNDARKYRFLGARYSWSNFFSPQLDDDDIGFEADGEGEGGEGEGGDQEGGESSQNRP
jgi:hypothetical protein